MTCSTLAQTLSIGVPAGIARHKMDCISAWSGNLMFWTKWRMWSFGFKQDEVGELVSCNYYFKLTISSTVIWEYLAESNLTCLQQKTQKLVACLDDVFWCLDLLFLWFNQCSVVCSRLGIALGFSDQPMVFKFQMMNLVLKLFNLTSHLPTQAYKSIRLCDLRIDGNTSVCVVFWLKIFSGVVVLL